MLDAEYFNMFFPGLESKACEVQLFAANLVTFIVAISIPSIKCQETLNGAYKDINRKRKSLVLYMAVKPHLKCFEL